MSSELRRRVHGALAHTLQSDPLFAPHADLTLRLEAELGRGGMGAVHRVQDQTLGRPAALKLMHSENPQRVARFLREARVTAGLDHPGIPPVYETGRYTDGRHFLLMRLIEGQTLTARIKALHHGGRPDRGELSELLRVLIRVAEAVGYAHSEGVVHRDLKPDNIMVGAFGEVLVMDWGLAKVEGQAEVGSAGLDSLRGVSSSGAATPLGSDDSPDSRLTRDGAVLGTPGYIAPEQLKGQSVDGRADVFALGVILTEVLCGKPAFPGESGHAVLSRNAAGEAVLPRQHDPAVPGALDAIARRALATSPQARFPSASAFADELRRFLAGERVACHRYGLVERARAWGSRHAPWLVVVALACALGLGAQVATLRAARVGAARERAVIADQAAALSERTWTTYTAAAAQPPATRVALALAALDAAQRWDAALDADPMAGSARARAGLALTEAALADAQLGLADAACAEVELLGAPDAEAARARVDAALRARGQAVEQVLRAAERGALQSSGERIETAVFSLMRHGGPDTSRRLADALDALSSQLEAAERALWAGAEEPSEAERLAGEGRLEDLAEAWDAYRLGRATPEDHARYERGFHRLLVRRAGHAPASPDRQREAVLASVAATQRQMITAPGWTDLASVCCQGLGQLGSPEIAVPALLRYQLAEGDPSRAALAGQALCVLGGQQALRGIRYGFERFGSTLTYAAGVRPWMPLLEGETTDLDASSLAGLIERATLAGQAGRPEQALTDLAEAIRREPDSDTAYFRRAELYADLGRHDEALRDFERALALEPRNVTYLNGAAVSRQALGDLNGALADFDKALAVLPDLPEVLINRSGARKELGDTDGALADLNRALELAPDLGAAVYVNRGLLHLALDDVEAALADMNAGVAADPNEVKAYVNRALVQLIRAEGSPPLDPDALDLVWADVEAALARSREIPSAWAIRGRVRQHRGDAAGALEDFDRALALDPQGARALLHRGELHLALGRPADALADLEALLALSPAQATALRLGIMAHVRLNQLDEALTKGERYVAVRPEQAESWSLLGELQLRAGGRAVEAERSLNKALELDPQRVSALINRGIARLQSNQPEAGVLDLTAALEQSSNEPVAWLWRGRARQQLGQLEGAEADLRQALELDPTLTDAWFYLGVIRQWNLELDGALEALNRADTGNPSSALLLQRGSLRLARGDWDAALIDLQTASETLPPQPYAPLMWVAVGGPRHALDMLRGGDDWLGYLARAILGELAPPALLSEAERTGQHPDRDTRLAEAHCYLGLLAERRGELQDAREHYRVVTAGRASHMVVEVALARARLHALERD